MGMTIIEKILSRKAGLDDVSVGEYQRLAHAAIDETEVPLVVGGTGLYFRAALSGFELPPPAAPGRRDFWQAEYERLRALGVRFTQEPTPMGPVVTAVLDDTCGNLIQLTAPAG